ncbi:28S ribosomal protein S5, mitochondrial [Cystobasidiomycetes sp. EMM_F5]
MQSTSVCRLVAVAAKQTRPPAVRPEKVVSSVSSRRRRRPAEIQPENPGAYLSQYGRSSGEVLPYLDLSAFSQVFDIHPDYVHHDSERQLTITEQHPEYIYEGADGQRETIKRFELSKGIKELYESAAQEAGGAGKNNSIDLLAKAETNPFSAQQLRGLMRFPLVAHRVVNMTSKGKIAAMYAMVVVGNGNGLVGVGEGKAETYTAAGDKAFVNAVKNMDYIQRKDTRTVWSDRMVGKMGATIVELRSRPPGFGLRCSPIIHQVAKAAGIMDLSAKVRGSGNSMNTVKATMGLLFSGAAPLAMGELTGQGKMSRRFKGVGMRTADEIGLDLGRRAVEIR